MFYIGVWVWGDICFVNCCFLGGEKYIYLLVCEPRWVWLATQTNQTPGIYFWFHQSKIMFENYVKNN